MINQKIATGDIVCYKAVIPIKGICRLFGYKYNSIVYREFKWKPGKLYYQKFTRPEVGFDIYIIEVGFHAFTFSPSKDVLRGDNIRVKCIIPKGTRYFRSDCGYQIVAERMMIVEEI